MDGKALRVSKYPRWLLLGEWRLVDGYYFESLILARGHVRTFRMVFSWRGTLAGFSSVVKNISIFARWPPQNGYVLFHYTFVRLTLKVFKYLLSKFSSRLIFLAFQYHINAIVLTILEYWGFNLVLLHPLRVLFWPKFAPKIIFWKVKY